VTNAEFIDAIYGLLPEGVSALVCGKHGDPTDGPWVAKPATQVATVCPPHLNNYINCATVHADEDGTWRARKSNVVGFHFLMLDDVGTKVHPEKLNGLKVTWAIETSPGNFQLGIVLEKPLTDLDEITRLQDAVIHAGLCDPGATGATRWARSPKGINGKTKYKSDKGEPFSCQLVRFRPELRYTVQEIVATLKLDLAPKQAPSTKTVAVPSTGNEGLLKAINPSDEAKLPALLAGIDPDCGRQEWLRVLMAVYHTTGGSDTGFALVNAWSSKGQKYKGTKELEIQWQSFRGDVSRPITIGTLIMMARNAGADVQAIVHEAFEPCETVFVGADSAIDASTETNAQKVATNPLTKFSLTNILHELEKNRVEQKLIFGELVLQGQATAIYARYNTGKTLILIYLIIEAIKQGLIDPAKIMYINMDDNGSGLVEKVRLAQEYGFHMAADGHQDFQAKEFRVAMEKMIEENSARGQIVILDTLKKFVNTMNKDASREFAAVVRRFCLKGGTVIALSHVNKKAGADGKAVYTGTTDIVDDFDCAYTLETIGEDASTKQKIVEYTNIKRRGNVARNAAYGYSTEQDQSYDELLLSVQEVDPDKSQPIKQAAELLSDAFAIAAVKSCIAEGVNTKMKMVDAVSKATKASRRDVLAVIEKYTDDDPSKGLWKFVVLARGAKVYEVLEQPKKGHGAVVEEPAPADLGQPKQQPSAPEIVTADQAFHDAILIEAMESYGGGYTPRDPRDLDDDGY
jgi:RecA-family ATPase